MDPFRVASASAAFSFALLAALLDFFFFFFLVELGVGGGASVSSTTPGEPFTAAENAEPAGVSGGESSEVVLMEIDPEICCVIVLGTTASQSPDSNVLSNTICTQGSA